MGGGGLTREWNSNGEEPPYSARSDEDRRIASSVHERERGGERTARGNAVPVESPR